MRSTTGSVIRTATATVAVGMVCALPTGASAAERPSAPSEGRQVAQQPSDEFRQLVRKAEKAKRSGAPKSHNGWGFNALLWESKWHADPLTLNRFYYARYCRPKAGVRYLKIQRDWIYRNYQCWAILS